MNTIKKCVIWSVLLSALIGLSGCGNSSSDVPVASDFSMTLDVEESTVSGDWKSLSSASGTGTLSASLVTQGKYGTFVVTGDSVTYTKTTETNETDIGILEITDNTDTIEVSVTVHSLYWEQISEGSSHTAAIKSDGTLWSWGVNNDGQLGDGTTTDSFVPVQEYTKATDWIIVSAGDFHTAAIKSDGTLWSWGLNNEGQLGVDTSIPYSTVPVQEDSYATDWIDVSAGNGYSIGKKQNGYTWRWGSEENTAPVADAQSVTTDEDTAILITLSGSDAENDPLTYSIVTGPSNGTLGTLSGNEVTYTPDADYVGADSFTFKVNDGTVDSAPATVSIAVEAAYNSDDVLAQIGLEADNPDIVNSVVTVAQLSAILPVLTNVIAVNETAYQNYIDANPDEFLNPATQPEVQAMIDIVNSANNNAPTASDFNMTLDINESTVIEDWKVLSSAYDGDGDTLSALVVTQGNYGTFVVTDDSLAYLKTIETNATDTGILEITDGIDTVEITVTINSLYWKEVSTGSSHTVAIKSDGTLWTWGYNIAGQLGDGTQTNSSVPVQESSAATNWMTASAGQYHTVAIKSDGTLWSWGGGNFGQLGDGIGASSLVPLQEITAASDWSVVSAGLYFTTALKSDGTLWSWGDNRLGQLGDGTTTSSLVPVQEITEAGDWKSVDAGFGHTVAIKTNGELWAWGDNDRGQLGDGTTTDSLVPVQESTAESNWGSVYVGYDHTVALKTNGTLWAWGQNGNGQLGDGTTTNSSVPVQEITAAGDWNSVGAGFSHTVAIKTNGKLWAWGENDKGQLGDGTIVDKLVPTQESTAASDWSAVSSGNNYTVALKSNGTLWSWGNNRFGQLGDGTTDDVFVPTQESTGAVNWSAVSSGGNHTVALKSDGTLWAWGYNFTGQLGDGTTTESSVPVQEFTAADDWSAISAGEIHTVALKSDGTLWAWGYNYRGQLGDGTTTNSLVPVQEFTAADDWSDISAGFGHTVALKSDGTLWAWGDNYRGQLGDGTTTESSVPVQEITTADDWTTVSAGSSHTVAIKSGGTLWSWGYNFTGQLGDGTTIHRSVPVQENTEAKNWNIVSAGASHTVAIKTNGQLWAWGNNYDGRLGDGTTTNSSVPVQEITSAEDWSTVSAGGKHTIALKSDRTLWTWGDNTYGQLGDGTTIDSSVPVQEITAEDNWSDISAGFEHSAVLKVDSTLWAWGDNDHGQVHEWNIVPALSQPRQP